ncbi:haloacid dehalogenase [Auricularia subglabra TFB-10046 SS5]|nr:haloacid dehalogenase [Auricularia subglabra TFB-10046 SS5]
MTTAPALPNVKALVFDIIGTTTDWYTPVHAALEAHNAPDPAGFVNAWRTGFKAAINSGAFEGVFVEMFGAYRRVLDKLCEERGIGFDVWNEAVRDELVASWGRMKAWPETPRGLTLLATKFILVGLSNGRASMMIDVHKKNAMHFDLLVTSDIVGAYKPSPKMYQTALSALNVKPEEVAMVAAHAYDLQAASSHGFRTIYLPRETEARLEPGETAELAREFDLCVHGGLIELANALGVETQQV